MTVYVVTKDQRLIAYDAPVGQQPWIYSLPETYEIFWKNCTCESCTDQKHRVLIAYVERHATVSIGFEQPFCIEGKMLTAPEKATIISIANWIERAKLKKRVPLAMDSKILKRISGNTELVPQGDSRLCTQGRKPCERAGQQEL